MIRKYSILFVGLFLCATVIFAQGGNALNFQNSNFNSHGDFVYCGQPDFGFTNELSVAVWAKWTTDPKSWSVANHGEREGQYSTYIAYSNHNAADVGSVHGQFWIRNSKASGKIEFTVENTSGTQVTTTTSFQPDANTWYFIVGTYDGSNVKLYVDGSLEDTSALTGNIRANTDCRLNFGRLPWGYGFFVGYLDEARVWNKALTLTEVQNQMASKATIQDAYCKSYWNFDAGSGTTITDSKGLASGTFFSCLTDIHGPNVDLPNKVLDDADRAFVTGDWDGKTIVTVSGAGVDETNIVSSNTNNVITLTYGFGGTAPDNRTTPVIDDLADMTWMGIIDNSESAQWVSSDLSLPVELESFNAEFKNDAVELTWSTESEKDNVGFILERRFAEKMNWEKIASHNTDERLRGHGTTSEKHSYTFIDTKINPGVTYEYRLSDVDINGNVEIKKTVNIKVESIPASFSLEQNYPNPFNPTTTINYSITNNELVTLQIFDVLGKNVATLVSQNQEAGSYSVEFNAERLSGGVYFYKLTSGNQISVKKMILVK